ncbi:ABC transporter permease [uncultured Phycicoccus sp.]|uniref:ABC transporter permease n=1 Tax=uncultured Phycicoccus sp. TaxID=661422 RepID=UPI00262BD3EF|nr:ABC transporter permease [uncultured Phycicoccus sp.]
MRRSALVWVLALVGTMAATAVSVAELYDTPTKVQTYADAIATDALVAVNGRVEGLDTLGGIVQDEFGFLAAFLMPLLGVGLVTAATRREEESGRLEQLLAGRVDRRAPVLASLVVVVVTVVVTMVGFAVSLVAAGVPTEGSVLYSLSLGALALVFAALAALLAQVVLHARAVYGVALAVLAVAYVFRGVGDVRGWWVVWLSPLGWAERTAPFGEPRWWVLLVPLVVAVLLAGAAVVLAARRDLGSALWRGGAGPERASTLLQRPLGLAWALQRGSFVGWLVGSTVLAAVMGSLAQEVVDALTGNPALEVYISLGDDPADGFLAMVVLYLAILGIGYVVQALGILRQEETEGRLEPQLAGTVARTRWLGAHLGVVLAGLVVILGASSAVLGLTSASVTGVGSVWPVVGAGLAYVPAVIVVAGLAAALFGLLPRGYVAAWGVFGGVTFIAFLGAGLQMPQWLLDVSPTTHVGTPPQGDVSGVALAVLVVVAAALTAAGVVGFRRRDVPRG